MPCFSLSFEKEFFNPTPIYSYGSSVATTIWGDPLQAVIVKNTELTDINKRQFLFMWKHTKKIPRK